MTSPPILALYRPVGPEELEEFNRHIIGLIEVIHNFPETSQPA